MQTVEVIVEVPGRTAADLYPILCEFESYPKLTDAVLRVDLLDLGDGKRGADWEVKFRRGILRWTEEDIFDDVNHRVDFLLVEGDVDSFVGFWSLTDGSDGATFHFEATFDMGIPTLAHVIEPIAARTLGQNMLHIVSALVGEVRVVRTSPEDIVQPAVP